MSTGFDPNTILMAFGLKSLNWFSDELFNRMTEGLLRYRGVERDPDRPGRYRFRMVRAATPEVKAFAWWLYVELQTRVATAPMADSDGVNREALQSLHSIFLEARRRLHDAGPAAGQAGGGDADRGMTVATITLLVLNLYLRPFLAKWHPALGDWELQKEDDVSAWRHEQNWERHTELRADLRAVQAGLVVLTEGLAELLELKAPEGLAGDDAVDGCV